MMALILQGSIPVPTAVYVIWAVTLAIAVLIILPLAVLLLQRTLKAARNIERYLAEMRDAGLGIARNTGQIADLDDTISVASQMLEVAQAIDEHAETIQTTLAARAGKDGHEKEPHRA